MTQQTALQVYLTKVALTTANRLFSQWHYLLQPSEFISSEFFFLQAFYNSSEC